MNHGHWKTKNRGNLGARLLCGLLIATLGLAPGCSGWHRSSATAPASTEPVLADTARPRVRSGQWRSPDGQRIDYRLFEPRLAAPRGQALIGHGFLRDQRRMEGLARALAAAGIRVATLDLPNSRPWSGGHVENARDMRGLARALHLTPTIYIGFSAGGLAALVAARDDPGALGVVTLDLVDTQEIGTHAASGLAIPLLGLFGEPTNCNAQGNGQRVFAVAPHGRYQRIAGASHCDFESPSDWLCETLCERPAGADSATATRIILATMAAVDSLVSATRGDPEPVWRF